MTRLTRCFGVLSLSTAMTLGASAQDKPKSDIEKLTDRVAELEKALKDQKTNATNEYINVLGDISKLKLDMENLQRGVTGAKGGETKSKKVGEEMPSDAPKKTEDVSRKIDLLQKDLDGIYQSLSKIQSSVNELKAANRDVRRIDTNSVKYGNVRVVNQYVTDMSVYINGRRYELPPSQEITIRVPAGQFNYQVPGIEEFVRTREVKADETFRVDIR